MTLEKLKELVGPEFSLDLDFIDSCVKKLALPEEARILDVGTGLGIMSSILAMNGHRLRSGEPDDFDYGESPTMASHDHHDHHHHGHDHGHAHGHEHQGLPPGFENISFDGKKNIRILGLEKMVSFLTLDVRSMELSDRSVDAIFLNDVFQHLQEEDHQQAMEECFRVLSEGGLVCVIEMQKETAERYNREEGFNMRFVDPGTLVDPARVSVESWEGEYSNFYVLKRKA